MEANMAAVIQTTVDDINGPIRICLRGEDSDDAFSLVDEMIPPGYGPPLHVHPSFAEGFYVLQGELTFQLGDDVVTGAAGSWIYIPKDTAHTFANLSRHPARALLICSPAGFERNFERILAEHAGRLVPEPSAAMRETYVVGPRIEGTLDVPLLS
jgi:quercetin dioxygenase-like cupin family protein